MPFCAYDHEVFSMATPLVVFYMPVIVATL